MPSLSLQKCTDAWLDRVSLSAAEPHSGWNHYTSTTVICHGSAVFPAFCRTAPYPLRPPPTSLLLPGHLPLTCRKTMPVALPFFQRRAQGALWPSKPALGCSSAIIAAFCAPCVSHTAGRQSAAWAARLLPSLRSSMPIRGCPQHASRLLPSPMPRLHLVLESFKHPGLKRTAPRPRLQGC